LECELMNTAFITYHDSSNYGANLQTVATYKALSSFSSCIVVDYRNPVISSQTKVVRLNGFKLARIAHDLLRLFPRYQALSKFDRFSKKHLNLSSVARDGSDISTLLKGVDIVFAGSDQVWNPECQTESDVIDPIYFLDIEGDFVKASYASSF